MPLIYIVSEYEEQEGGGASYRDIAGYIDNEESALAHKKALDDAHRHRERLLDEINSRQPPVSMAVRESVLNHWLLEYQHLDKGLFAWSSSEYCVRPLSCFRHFDEYQEAQ